MLPTLSPPPLLSRAPPPVVVPSPPARVPWRERIAYGAGGLPATFGMVGLKNLAIPVYQMTLKVDPALLGLAMAIPRFWEAFTDPIMGHLSDRTRSRYGRRRPYILAGAPLTALSFVLIWMVPAAWPEAGKLAWFVATSLLFYTSYTVWSVPYQSLGYELTPDYHERTTVMGVQTLFGKVTGFTADWIFPLSQLGIFLSVMHGVRWMTALVAAVIFAGVGLLPGLFVRERFAAAGRGARRCAPAGFWRGCVESLQNRGMRVLMALVCLGYVAGMFTSGLDYYLLVYFVCGGDIAEGAVWKAVLSSVFAGVGIAAIWLIGWLSRRYDKKNALTLVYGLVALGGIAKWFLFREDVPWLCVFIPLLCAPIFTGHAMLAQSMIADICDEDELRHGERREGLFGAMHGWIGKTAGAAAIFGAGVTLNLVGFDAAREAAQDPDALLRIRYVLVLATTLPALIAILALRCYPLDETRMAFVRAELERRRRTC